MVAAPHDRPAAVAVAPPQERAAAAVVQTCAPALVAAEALDLVAAAQAALP
jgi:hypothetical protein